MKQLLSLSFLFAALVSARAEFCAYYTKINSGQPFEEFSRTGPEADVVVQDIGPDKGRFVFWRGSSYLPYFETKGGKWFAPELTERKGDGPPERPDKVNTYSVARIIESSPDKVVIHWRYLPKFEGTNPHYNATNLPKHLDKLGGKVPAHLVDPTRFVDEYFTITPDGKVSRTFKEGTGKYNDWTAPGNFTVQDLKLTKVGIAVESTQAPPPPVPAKAIPGSPLKDKIVVPPVKWWKFDEGGGDTTREHSGGDSCAIAGPMSYWKRGVSGTALAFDGYHSVVRLSAGNAPALSDAVTLEGWVALGAYPWNWTPVVQQGHEERYSLAIGPHGSVAMAVKAGGRLVKAESKPQLATKRWYHVAGTYDKASGAVRVFIDGKLCAEQAAPKDGLARSDSPLQIGKGAPMGQSDPVRFADPHDFSFDGLIDEVRIYSVALSPGQVAASCSLMELPESARVRPDLDRRVLPAGLKTGRFGAYYTHLPFYDTWEGMFRFSEHPDVVVEFDKQPTSFVFWRGVGFITMMVNERGGWYSNEFNETWNRSGGKGCQEPMSDKEAFSNHAKILENTPARTVVQWRYPLVDVFHTIANHDEETGWGDWSDWTYTIYPDGVAAKNMRLWTSGPLNHEWQEGMVITGPDQHPEQVVETDPALVLATLTGEIREYSWKNGPPRGVNYRDAKIHVINFKGEYDPFTIGDFQKGNVYGGELTDYSVFPSWNHWPVAQMPSDGRYAKHPDRTAHSSLTHVVPAVHHTAEGKRPYQERLLLEGMSRQTPAELATLARSWLHAPALRGLAGCTAEAYNPAKREYPLRATDRTLSVAIDASPGQPLVNLCLSVKNWGGSGAASVLMNGKTPGGVRQGTFVDTDGTRTMVIWIEVAAVSPTEFTISGANPAP
jgi:hypothetical protein